MHEDGARLSNVSPTRTRLVRVAPSRPATHAELPKSRRASSSVFHHARMVRSSKAQIHGPLCWSLRADARCPLSGDSRAARETRTNRTYVTARISPELSAWASLSEVTQGSRRSRRRSEFRQDLE